MSLVPSALRRFPVAILTVLSLAAAGGMLLLYRYHPSELRLPQCVWFSLTGLYCPGCGSTRALHYLLHGELGRAFRMNGFMVLSLPLLLWSFTRWLRYRVWGHVPRPVPYAALLTRMVALAIMAYFVLRNIPGTGLAPH